MIHRLWNRIKFPGTISSYQQKASIFSLGLEERMIKGYWGKCPYEDVLIIVMNFSYLDTKIRI